MRITNYSIDMSAKTTHLTYHSEEETLKLWVDPKVSEDGGKKSDLTQNGENNLNNLTISEEGLDKLSKNKGSEENDSIGFEVSDKDKQKISLIEKFIEVLTGKKIKINLPEKIKLKANTSQINIKDLSQQEISQGWGMEYNYNQSHYEKETMDFNSTGIIRTADGKEISFSLKLAMKREFISQKNISIRAGDAKIDPLVINYEKSASGLTDGKIDFDLDFDGKMDKISFVSKGSGFLALDKNNDGKINDGSELFGPQSGDGFFELSKYDVDGNNWIDENDPLFDNLKIWIKDDEGEDVFFTLKQKGIGALYLGNISTPFEIKNGADELKGEVAKTGIFIRENGVAGSIQHIDIAI